jgi:hypothetical protein
VGEDAVEVETLPVTPPGIEQATSMQPAIKAVRQASSRLRRWGLMAWLSGIRDD